MKDNPQLESKTHCYCDKVGSPDKHSCPHFNYENKCTYMTSTTSDSTSMQPIPSQSASIETVFDFDNAVNAELERYPKMGKLLPEIIFHLGATFGAQWQSNSQQQVDNWISVEDRLPEIKNESGCYQKVLVCWGTNMQSQSSTMNYVCRFVKGSLLKRFEYHLRVSPFKVTHWQPLPNKPQ